MVEADAGDGAPAEASGEPIFLFVPAELSGAGATVGTNWRDGVAMAIADINAAGGILGRPIEYEVVDTQSDSPAGSDWPLLRQRFASLQHAQPQPCPR